MALILSSPFCVYCGNAATARDHFIPISQERAGDVNFELPACTSCNSTAGGRYFSSFDEKAAWILDRRIAKGAAPQWSNLLRLAKLTDLAIRLNKFAPQNATRFTRYEQYDNWRRQNPRTNSLGRKKNKGRATWNDVKKIMSTLPQSKIPFVYESGHPSTNRKPQ